VTARLNVTFRQPVPVGERLRIVGEVARERSRAIETHGAVSRASDGAVLAEAEAVFVLMPDDRRRELERKYSRTDETFARVRAAVDAEERMREHGRT
jgi:acyl-CoA thioesterase FadM